MHLKNTQEEKKEKSTHSHKENDDKDEREKESSSSDVEDSDTNDPPSKGKNDVEEDDEEWEKFRMVKKKDKALETKSKKSHAVHCPYFPDVCSKFVFYVAYLFKFFF